jgi:hypothetical protein
VLFLEVDASELIVRSGELKMAPRTAKERVAYWATKLECPVDDNANYENTYVCRGCLSGQAKADEFVSSGATGT